MEKNVRSLKLSFVVSILLLKAFEISSEITTAMGKRRANFDNKTNAFRQLWIVPMNSAYFCIAQCNKDVQCASVFFNMKLRQCRGHSVTLSKQENTLFEDDSRYYIMRFGEQYIGDSCFTDSDCWTPNTECRQEMCVCIPGYSFAPSTHECKVCSHYGDQFIEIPHQWITLYNVESFQGKNFDECAQLCLSRTVYVCVTFEFTQSTGECYLQEKTRFEVPQSSWIVDYDYSVSHFQRDCA